MAWCQTPCATLRAGRLPADQMCNPEEVCPLAIVETAPCAGSGYLAYDRRRLQRPIQVAAAPTTSLFLGSSDSGLQACDSHRSCPTNSAKDDCSERPCDMAPGISPFHAVLPPKNSRTLPRVAVRVGHHTDPGAAIRLQAVHLFDASEVPPRHSHNRARASLSASRAFRAHTQRQEALRPPHRALPPQTCETNRGRARDRGWLGSSERVPSRGLISSPVRVAASQTAHPVGPIRLRKADRRRQTRQGSFARVA